MRLLSIGPALELIQRRLLARRVQLENGPVDSDATGHCGTVKIARRVADHVVWTATI